MKIGRNNLCHCESNKKYKKCCLQKDKLLSQVRPQAMNIVSYKTYRDRFGSNPDFEEFIGIVKKYPVQFWLDFLSKIEYLLITSHSDDEEVQKNIAKYLLPDLEMKRIFVGGHNFVLFNHVQLNYIKNIVIIYCEDYDFLDMHISHLDLYSVLLMANDLFSVKENLLIEKDAENQMRFFAQRSLGKHNPEDVAIRLFRTFKIFIKPDFQSEHLVELREMFKDNTEFEMDEYLSICFYVFCCFHSFPNIDIFDILKYNCTIDLKTYFAKVEK